MARTRTASRLDGTDQYFLDTQLQSIDPTKYYHLVPGLVGRKILAVIDGVSPNLPVYKYVMTKLQGRTKRTKGKSKAGPTVGVTRTNASANIETYEAEATWTVDELRAARETNQDLPGDTLAAAVTTIEQDLDETLAIGDAEVGTTGLANNADVLHTDAAAGAGSGNPRSWLSPIKTVDEIMADIASAVSDTQDALKQGQVPGSDMPMFDSFALYLPVKHLTNLMTRRLGSNNDVSLLKYIRDNFEMITSIRAWWRLGTADADNGDGPMAVLAPAMANGTVNPLAAGALLPGAFDQLPEQYDGRNIIVPCAQKSGGVPIRYPVAFRYLKRI